MHKWFSKRGQLATVFILAQVAWCSAHLLLTANGHINPWKMGGYGMYTTPSFCPIPRVTLIGESERNFVPSAEVYRIYSGEFVSGCLSKPDHFYRALAEELLAAGESEGIESVALVLYGTMLNKVSFESEYREIGRGSMVIGAESVIVEEKLCERQRILSYSL